MSIHKRKSIGQHFLRDPQTAGRIAEMLLLPDSCRDVIEIGPGGGILTQFLVKNEGIRLKLCELDERWAAHLQSRFPSLASQIYNEDFLKLDLKKVFNDHSFAIIGNFPYQISSQILFRMLDYKAHVPILVGMFQREVAERVCGTPGGKNYGILSVLLSAYYDTEIMLYLEPGEFDPPPRVKSAVIRLTRNNVMHLDCDEKLFRQVVKTAFNQRRKQLRNALKSMSVPDQAILTKRAEELSVADFINLTNSIATKEI